MTNPDQRGADSNLQSMNQKVGHTFRCFGADQQANGIITFAPINNRHLESAENQSQTLFVDINQKAQILRIMQGVGQYIQQLRKEVPIWEIASTIGMSTELLAKIMQGKIHATREQLFSLSSCFKINFKDLMINYQSERLLSETKTHPKRQLNMMEYLSKLRTSNIQIRHHRPSFPLNQSIESIIYCKGHNLDYPFETVNPDGTVQLLIKLEDENRVIFNHSTQSNVQLRNAWITGIQKQQLTYQLGKTETALYVRFRPGGFYSFSGIPQTELADRVLEADLLLGRSISQLREELQSSTDIQEIFRKVEKYFLKRIDQQPDMTQHIINYVYKHIASPLPSITQKTGYSQKHVIHLFKKHVGVTPKYFQRIDRFNRALNTIQTTVPNEIDWSTITHANRYYDQSHFIKEFHHFSGISPHEFMETGSSCATFIHSNAPI